MKLSEFIKNNDIELTEEQEKQIKEFLGIKENKKWMPKENEIYYYIATYGEANNTTYFKISPYDNFNLENNNCFKTKEEAEFRLEQIKVYNELKNFANGNNDELDWEDGYQEKYYIGYDCADESIFIDSSFLYKYIGEIYFSSQELAKQAIKEIGEDRIKKYLFEVE